jgi:hypothetical protein
MDLPSAAAAMYNTWWSFAQYAANATNADGSWAYTVTDASSAASQVNRDVYGGAGGYNPIGLSQLFSVARKIGNTASAIASADDDSPVTDKMVAQAPWSRPPAEMAASPQWWARTQATYLAPDGTEQTGTFMIAISQVLPYSVGALKTLIDIQTQSQLADMSPTKTPRSGTLISTNSIQLLAW